MENKYISESKEESIEKAIQMMQQTNNVKRPQISVKKIIFRNLIIFVSTIFLIIGITTLYIGLSNIPLTIILIILLVALIMATIKNTIKNTILLYQKYAPESLRASCLFQPSCSEYMILAINKYGTIKGTYKGIKRLLRCHSPNGGIDYP